MRVQATTYSRSMVRLEWRDRVVVITIDRPERRNALDHATLLALADAQRAAADGGARALVLTGSHPAFCAGAMAAKVQPTRMLNVVLFMTCPLVWIELRGGNSI